MPTRTPIVPLLALSLLAGAGCGEGSAGGHARPQFLVMASAARQTGRAGAAVASPPTVRVVDAAGNRLPGVVVRFELLSGEGSLGAEQVVSSAAGSASTPWVLGIGADQQVRATCPDLPGAEVRFTAAAMGGAGYQIDVRLLTEATDAEWEAFTGAAARIAEVVVGDLPPVLLGDGFRCDGTAVTGEVDDLLILARVQIIDGVGGILGQAGPCAARSGSPLPAVGVMEFDSADLAALEETGRLQAVILHEMLHVVGFGTVWSDVTPPLLAGAGTADSAFAGAQALAAATGWNGAPAGWTSVPVENCGAASPSPCGSGTRDAHWREPVFGTELMTGWLGSSGESPLSRTTAASLADLGYQVDLDAADPFDLSAVAGSLAGLRDGGQLFLGDDLRRLPLVEVPPAPGPGSHR